MAAKWSCRAQLLLLPFYILPFLTTVAITRAISEDGCQVELPGAKEPFSCSTSIVDPLSLAYQFPAALRLFHESGSRAFCFSRAVAAVWRSYIILRIIILLRILVYCIACSWITACSGILV